MGSLLTYGIIVIFILIFVAQYYFGRGKKVMKMTNETYFNNVVLKELNKHTEKDTDLIIGTSVNWRNSMNTKTHNYYLGLTDKKLILIKVKSYLGSFTDTSDNKTLINNDYDAIKDLIITDEKITEQADKVFVTSNIKRIKFRVASEEIDLKIKYQNPFGKEIPVNKIESMLIKKSAI